MKSRQRMIYKAKHIVKLSKWREWREQYVPKEYWKETYFFPWMW